MYLEVPKISENLSILNPGRARGQGDGPRQLRKYWPSDRDPTVRIDRDVNFAKKNPNFVKMNTESINLTENPSDFVEPYFTKNLNF